MSKTDQNTEVLRWGKYSAFSYVQFENGKVISQTPTTYSDIFLGRTKVNRTSASTSNYLYLSTRSKLPDNPFVYSFLEEKAGSKATKMRDYDQWSASQGYAYKYTFYNGDAIVPSLSDLYNYPTSYLAASSILALDANAKNQLLSNVKDMKLNLGQAIGERQQTIDLLFGTAKDIVKIAKNLRSGNFVGAAEAAGIPVSTRRQRRNVTRKHRSRARRGADSLANRWLEFQYGWKPLLSDVFGAAESLAKALSEKPPYGDVHGRARRHYSGITNVNTVVNTKDLQQIQRITFSGDYEISYGARFSTSTFHWPTALGLTNPLELVWELLPFSFVADWFANVGSTLSNLDATLGCTFMSGYKTEWFKVKYEALGSTVGSYAGHYYYYNSGSAELVYTKTVRTKLTDFPSVGKPVWKDNPLNANKIVTAVALVNQIFRK